MQIHPIRSEKDHEEALARIEALMDDKLTRAEEDELDVLVTLVDVYESKHFPISTPDPVAIIEFYLDQNGLTRRDMEPLIGSRARISEVMTGKRSLTIPMIQRLRDCLGISADLLIARPHKSRQINRPKSSRDKKELSLQRDRRNTYGENAKASRKSIPKAKQRSHQATTRRSL